MTPLVFRADAGDRIGSGHLMRCLALASAWDAPCTFVTAAPGARVEAAGGRTAPIDAAPGSIDDARATAAIAHAVGAEWVVVDGYDFGVEYQRALRQSGLRTLCIDDNGEAGEYAADIIVNQNLHASSALYVRRAEPCELLLGSDYVLMRPEFVKAPAPTRRAAPEAARLLVTLGGGSDERLLLTILEALTGAGLPHLDVTVLTGGVNTPALRAAASRVPGQVRCLERTDAMRDLMERVDLAVSAAGSTTWELAYMGVPAALVVVASNQLAAASASVKHEIAVLLGKAEELQEEQVARVVGELARDQERRGRMSAAGQRLFDGRGASRVIARMRALAPAPAETARSRAHR